MVPRASTGGSGPWTWFSQISRFDSWLGIRSPRKKMTIRTTMRICRNFEDTPYHVLTRMFLNMFFFKICKDTGGWLSVVLVSAYAFLYIWYYNHCLSLVCSQQLLLLIFKYDIRAFLHHTWLANIVWRSRIGGIAYPRKATIFCSTHPHLCCSCPNIPML